MTGRQVDAALGPECQDLQHSVSDEGCCKSKHCLNSSKSERVQNYLGISINGGTPIAGWFRMENPMNQWMITRGTPMT